MVGSYDWGGSKTKEEEEEACKPAKKWRNYTEYDFSLHDYPFVWLSLDDTGVSQQIAFISGPSLHLLSKHIFEILQDLTVAEIKW